MNFNYFYVWGHHIVEDLHNRIILIPSSMVVTIWEVDQVGIIFCEW